MELPTKEQNAKSTKKSSVVFFALLRLSLLIVPEFFLVRSLTWAPLMCILAATAYFGLWLVVDVWPFRVATPVPAVKKAIAQSAAAKPAYAQNLTKAQWLSNLFVRVALLFAVFHSKIS